MSEASNRAPDRKAPAGVPYSKTPYVPQLPPKVQSEWKPNEEELPGAFAAVKTYRVHAVPLTDLTARAIIDACMRVERPDIAVHVLNNKHLLRVWPAAPEYATVVGALLGSDRPLGDEGLSLAVTLCSSSIEQAWVARLLHRLKQARRDGPLPHLLYYGY